MPSAVVKKYVPTFAKKKGLSKKEAEEKLEEYWDKAKEIATSKGFEEGSDTFWSYVMGIWEKMSGYKSTATSSGNVSPFVQIEINI